MLGLSLLSISTADRSKQARFARVLLISLFLSLFQFLPVAPADAAANNKVTICHRTKATKNPYRKITVSISAVNNTNSTHRKHGDDNDVWTSADSNGGSWGDIIPTRKNWSTGAAGGQAIFNGQVFVPSTGKPACRGMNLKEYFDSERAAGVDTATIVADLNEANSYEDQTLLKKTGQSSFSVDNITSLNDASVTISVTTDGPTSISTTGATLNGRFKTDATSVYYFFEYNSGDSTFADEPTATTCTALGSTNGTYSKTATLSISSPGTGRYYYRAVLVSDCGTSPDLELRGEIYSFKFSNTTYKVTYNASGGTGDVPTDANAYVAGDTAFIFGNSGGLTKAGSIFRNWSLTAPPPGPPSLLTASQIITSDQVLPRNLRTTPEVRALIRLNLKSGYLKVGVAPRSANAYGAGDQVTVNNDIVLYATYDPVYTVTYNGNTNDSGSAPTDSTNYTSSQEVTVVGNTGSLVKSGYTFAGWCTTTLAAGAACTGTTYVSGNKFNITDNVNLYAIWTANNYKITYNNNTGSGTLSDTTFTFGNTATVANNSFTKSGYTFQNWYTNSTGTGGTSYNEGANYSSAADLSLFAIWSGNKYVYNGNGSTSGTVPSDQTYSGTTLTAATTNLGRTDGATTYTFYGWCLTQETAGSACTGTRYPSGSELPIPNAATVNLYALWTLQTLYTLSYNSQGGDAVASNTFASGDVVTLPSAPSRTGYTFNGWFENSSGGSALGSTYNTTGLTANKELFAQWTIKTYTLSYDINGATSGTNPSDVTQNYNTTINYVSQGDLLKTGNTFGGWTFVKDSGTAFTNSDQFTFTETRTVFAKWTKNSYTLTFNFNGGAIGANSDSTTVSVVFDVDGLLSKPDPAPTRSGFSFVGWGLTNSSTTALSTYLMPAENKTLYAIWTTDPTYTISYNANGGSGTMSSTTFTSGSSATISSNSFTRSGYTFSNWYTTTSGTGGTSYSAGSSYSSAANLVLYAIWQVVSSGGGTTTTTTEPTTSSAQTQETPPAPKIVRISNSEICSIGNEVVITGDYLDNAKVTLNDAPAVIKSQTGNIITVLLPSSTSGKKTIKVTTANGSALTYIDYVTVPKPKFEPIRIPYLAQNLAMDLLFSATNASSYKLEGRIPSGVTMDTKTGRIAGVPGENGIYVFTIVASGICGDTHQIVELDVDATTPNAISHRINFAPGSCAIPEAAKASLQRFLDEAKGISPRNIIPEIYVSGGGKLNDPNGELAQCRQEAICDLLLLEELLGEVLTDVFTGSENRIEIIVYWPRPNDDL